MNQKNTEFFFGDEESTVLTLEDEDGGGTDVMLLASFEIEELGTEYLISVELDGDDMTEDVQILKYEEDEDGEPMISSIDDEEEYEIASQVCRQILKSGEIEGFDVEEDEDDYEDGFDEDDYLSDIGTIFPGLSIDRD